MSLHRGNFRPRQRVASGKPPKEAAPVSTSGLVDELKAELSKISKDINPIKVTLERLSAPKKDVFVPDDIAKSLGEIQNRLDRLEKNQKKLEDQAKRMAETFSNAILKLGDKVEKVAGVEDSSFSLAHSLEQLLAVLSSRKLKVIRDSNGDMTAVEVTSGPQN